MLTPPLCRNTLARKRPTPGTVWAKSTSPSSSNRARRLAGMMAPRSRADSWPPGGACARRRSCPHWRNAGGDPTLMWRSEPSLAASWRSQSTSSTTAPPGTPGPSANYPVPVDDRLLSRHGLLQTGHGQAVDLRQVGQEHPPLLGRLAQDLHVPLELCCPLAHPLLEDVVLVPEPEVERPGLQEVPDPKEGLVVVERLGEEVPSPHGECPLSRLGRGVGCEDQDRHVAAVGDAP